MEEEHKLYDLSYKNSILTNKYMKKMEIEKSNGNILLFGEPLSSISRKVNADIIKMNLDNEIDLLFSPVTSLSEISWEDKRKFEIDKIFKDIDLSKLNINDSINYLIPEDSTMFTYSWSNPTIGSKSKNVYDQDPLIRDFISHEKYFNPYFSNILNLSKNVSKANV